MLAMEQNQWMAKLEAALSDATGKPVQILKIKPLAGGACQENFGITLQIGDRERRFALRSDAVVSLPGSLGRNEEYAVVRAAVLAGVPTPMARWKVPNLLRPGATAVVLDWCEGVAIGARVLKDPRLEEARNNLPEALARALAAIHSIAPAEHAVLPLTSTLSAAEGQDACLVAVAQSEGILATVPVRPAVSRILHWLKQNVPAPASRVLVHGDFRVGNFMVSPTGLQGVLDWEFAHWGDAHCDLAWICVRDWRFGRLNRPVGGLTSRADFMGRYTAASGRQVDPARLHWWEVMGNLRWAVGAVSQAYRVLSGAEANLELLAIGRRAAEMEWEALRLIRRGPYSVEA